MKRLITASLLFSAAFLLNTNEANAQVGIGTTTPHSSAALEINSSNKGILVPRMTQANRPASPATGLLIYQTDNTPGFYVYNGSAWVAVSGSSAAPSISLLARASSPYLASAPGAIGPYFFNPVPYQIGNTEVILPANNPTTAVNGTTKYTGFVVPANCTFTKIKLAARVIAGGVDNSTNNTTTVTLFKNGVSTGLSVQVTTGSAIGASGANAVTGNITAVGGDIISYQYTQTNQEPTTSYSIVLEGQ